MRGGGIAGIAAFGELLTKRHPLPGLYPCTVLVQMCIHCHAAICVQHTDEIGFFLTPRAITEAILGLHHGAGSCRDYRCADGGGKIDGMAIFRILVAETTKRPLADSHGHAKQGKLIDNRLSRDAWHAGNGDKAQVKSGLTGQYGHLIAAVACQHLLHGHSGNWPCAFDAYLHRAMQLVVKPDGPFSRVQRFDVQAQWWRGGDRGSSCYTAGLGWPAQPRLCGAFVDDLQQQNQKDAKRFSAGVFRS